MSSDGEVERERRVNCRSLWDWAGERGGRLGVAVEEVELMGEHSFRKGTEGPIHE